MMGIYRRIREYLFGQQKHEDSEYYFSMITFFSVSVFLIILASFHIVLQQSIYLLAAAFTGSILFFSLFLWVKASKKVFLPKLIASIGGLLLLDIAWYTKHQSLGSILFFFFAFGALIIWFWKGKHLIIMLLLFFVNIAFLFSIEYLHPNLPEAYSQASKRQIEIYFSFFLYSTIMMFLLSQIKKDFERQRNRAIRSDKLKSAFLSNMSHEIRTPLNAIVGFSQLLDVEEDKTVRTKYATIIQNSSDNLLALINEIVDLSKIEAGYIKLDYSKIPLKELFDNLITLFEKDLSKRGKEHIELNFFLPFNDILVMSDYHRLKQIFSNFLSNAVKFTEKGKITMGCTLNETNYIFSVEDTGTGIPENDQEKIFDRFNKFDYKNMNNEGSGIGLALVQRIINKMEGKLWLESEWGKGSKFFFSLPIDSKTTSLSQPQS